MHIDTKRLVINCYGGFGSVRDHATMMGMLLPEDEKYLWIAEESLFAHLPEGTVNVTGLRSLCDKIFCFRGHTSSVCGKREVHMNCPVG